MQKFNNGSNASEKEITNLKEAAISADNKLRSLFYSSSTIHLLIDKKMCLVDFNNAAQHFMEKYYGILLYQGISVIKFVHKEHLASFLKCYKKALSGVQCRVERTLHYGKTKIIWFLNYEPAVDKTGAIIGMSYNAIDMTDKIASDDKISSQYHCLNEIAHIQSHHLYRPMANMGLLMDTIKKNGYRSTGKELMKMEKVLLEIQKQVKRISHYIA